MKEEFLHYLWKNKLFFPDALRTLSGERISVKNPGLYNKDAGPDFLGARMFIGDIEWCGDVEIHLKTSDFFLHQHQHDSAYSNLLLHLVHEHDTDFPESVHTCVVKDCFQPDLLVQYKNIFLHKNPLACSGLLADVPDLTWTSWLDRMLYERIEFRHMASGRILQGQQFHAEETLYIMLASAFGFSVNRTAFEYLALQTPYRLLMQYRDNRLQIEALLLGQAGFLDKEYRDEYLKVLQNEYVFLAGKHKLKIPLGIHWKYLRLRPGNFPCIRISQFAGLLCKHDRLYDALTGEERLVKLKENLRTCAHDYWNNHYMPERRGKETVRQLGSVAIEGIILNAVVPFLFLAGTRKKEPSMVMRAHGLLQQLKAEENKVTRYFTESGKYARHAGDTQSLKHLYDHYCNKRKCLDCAIGNTILSKARSF
jgi:hypothetical protein